MPYQPIEQVLEMVNQGIPNEEIIRKLQAQGFSNTDIQEAISQAQTKASIESTYQEEIPPAPPSPQMQPSVLNTNPQQTFTQPEPEMQPQPLPSRDTDERIEEIAESIIDEKWQRVVEDIGDLSVWKDKIKTEITSIKQEVLRIESRFESLQKSIMGRIKEYDTQVGDVGTDVRAIEKLLQNILKPLTNNVKELKRITEKLKK